MYKFSYLKTILIIISVLIVISVVYAELKSLGDRNDDKNQKESLVNMHNNKDEPEELDKQKTSRIDIYDWKEYQNGEHSLAFKYPSYFEVDDSSNKGISGTDILLYLIAKEKKDSESQLRFLIQRNYSWNYRAVEDVLSEISSGMKESGEAAIEIFKLQKYDMARSNVSTSVGTYHIVVIGDGKKNVAVQSNHYLEDEAILDQIISTFQLIGREEEK